jgi:translation initiation factor 3 subunit H
MSMTIAEAARAAAAASAAAAQPTPVAAPVRDPDYVVNLEGIDPALLVSKPLTEVQLDALVVMKILKHCRDNHPVTAYGQLLGVDISGVLEVTNCFPVTSKSQDDDDSNALRLSAGASDEMDGAEYQLQMLRCLRKMNYDASSVGLYVSTHLGSFWNQTIIENQFSYQKLYAQSVLIVYDPTRTSQGNLSLRALRLSDTFMTLFKDKKFTMEALHEHKLTASGIFESLPIRIKNSHLLNALLHQWEAPVPLSVPKPASSYSLNTDISSSSSVLPPLTPNLDALDLGTDNYLERHLEYLGETVEEYGQEQWRWQGWNRSLQKEQQRAAQVAAKRRQENATRASSGLPPLYSDEELLAPPPSLARLLANEPSRLETLIITNQIDTYCKQINQFAGPAMTKMFLAKAVTRS